MFVAFAAVCFTANAQIDSKVKDVMQKCVKAMENRFLFRMTAGRSGTSAR